MISFCTLRKAKSYNAGKKKLLRNYEQAIAADFQSTGQVGFGKSGNLYSRVYYFHREHQVADADNISKPILDALTGHAYADDKQVIFRSAASLNMEEGFVIDYTNLSSDLVADITNAVLQGKSIIYIEVGAFSNDFIQFGVNTQ
ncbi:RusA family crossover junction endodeoxyribonuclease [Alicyclobacillus fodiniaquatilis]|uniref:RusA family crossover junction endodeoxyribonuclease n=1 Tax=Alicyclobacillus fodiniaquatilis TaxID=1661150 RepID=A0ABW4JPP8_9BACL